MMMMSNNIIINKNKTKKGGKETLRWKYLNASVGS